MLNSPSSSSIRSPLSKSSLPQLPVELLRQIIEQSVPSYYHALSYQNRQLTLRNLCLTSRLFREIAQPILVRFDRLRFLHGEDSIEQNASARASRTNVLSISIAVEMPLERINTLLLAHAQLKELHVDSSYDELQDIDISLLAFLPNLESLTIHGARLAFATPRPLAALRYLTLSECDGDLDPLFAQLSQLPSLQIFALLDNLRLYDPIHNTNLLPQLGLFICNPHALKEEVLNRSHNTLGHKMLCACRYDHYISGDLTRLKVQHFRLRVSSVDLETAGHVEDLYETFNEIRAFLAASGTPLKTLFLDQGLRDALSSFRFTQATYDRLIKTCEERGIEVILEEQTVLDSADSAITPELLRWMDRKKESARLSMGADSEMGTR